MKIKEGKEAEYKNYIEINQDGYGSAVVRYGERWAALMELSISTLEPIKTAGEVIREVAKSTSHDADTEGITGFMYGCAVQALAEFWEHGEDLRWWHNLDTQIGTEGEKANETGGVLNPVLLNIGG